MKVLIVQTAFPGDTILTTPLIRTVAESTGEPPFVIIRPECADILKNNPHIGEILTYDKKSSEQGILHFINYVKKLKEQKFSLALVPHRSFRSAMLVYLAGIPGRIGFSSSAGSFLFTQKVEYRNDIHETERNITLSIAAGFQSSSCIPEIFPDDSDSEIVNRVLDQFLDQSRQKMIVFAPGSVWPTKRWPETHYHKLTNMILEKNDVKIILIGGKEDKELCERIRGGNSSILNTAGYFSFRQSAYFISLCTVLVSGDSAPAHLASAVGTKTICIFGPTDPSFGFGPLATGSIVLKRGLSCQPCHIHGPRKCPKNHFECMNGISPEEVYNAIQQVLHNPFVKPG